MNKYIIRAIMAMAITTTCASCDDFVFGNVHVNYDESPLNVKSVPHSGADRYVDSLKNIKVTEALSNPDPQGAFNNWATCLVMFKEGHKHGDQMMHGNFVYPKAPWKQEEFAIIHNNSGKWPTVDVQRQSTATYLEVNQGKEGPDYIRLIGGRLKRWGLNLYFFDKDGRIINDDILEHGDEYQIFYTVSDLDDKGNPYTVMDCRGTWHSADNYGGGDYGYGDEDEDEENSNYNELSYHTRAGSAASIDPEPVPSLFFADKNTWKERAEATPEIFQYTYRDTWTHDIMGDGAREMFNIRLNPPLTKQDADWAVGPEDQDHVGLKGHFNFDIEADESNNGHEEWPFKIKNRPDPSTGEPSNYTRPTYLLPKFYLSVRIMKCPKGKKALIPKGEYLARHSTYEFLSEHVCNDFNNPDEAKEYGQDSEWQEVFRFNIPIKIFCSSFDTDPTSIDPYDPFYYYLGLEMGLSPEEALEAAQNVQTHGIGGGSGFGNWFM